MNDALLDAPRVVEEARVPEEFTNEEKASQLPKPSGWKLLCAVPVLDAKFENSSLVRPDKVIEQEQFATVVLFVMELGPDAYKHEKFASPWCKKGDFIIVRQYAGTRVRIWGKEFRFINDDQVEGVIADPRGVSRV